MPQIGFALFAVGGASIARGHSAGTSTTVAIALFCLTLLVSVLLSVRVSPLALRYFPTRLGKFAITAALFGSLFAACWLAGMLVVAVAQFVLTAHDADLGVVVTWYGYLCLSVLVPCVLLVLLLAVLGTWMRRKPQPQ